MYSDEQIIAYLDDTSAPDASEAIETAAKQDAELRDRIAALQLDASQIQSAFDPLLGVAATRNLDQKLACAIDHEAANRVNSTPVILKVFSYVATAAAAIVVTLLLAQPKPDWKMEVAHYQALYVADTLMPVAPDIERLRTEFARASTALDLDLSVETLGGFEGLELRRAQILGFDDNVLVQIAFTREDGTPIAFCILQKAQGTTTDPTSQTLVGLASASWDTPTHRFLTIGGTDTSKILRLAVAIQSQI